MTGSCHLSGSLREHGLLIDCGMEQGPDQYENQETPGGGRRRSTHVLLTHAHIDHSGNIPLLCQSRDLQATDGHHLCHLGSVSASCSVTAPTSRMFEAQWRNRKARRSGGELYEPVYTMADADAAIQRFAPCDYEQTIDLCQGIKVRFNDMGHLLGSASIEVWVTEEDVTKKIVFSGDVGNTNQPIIRDPQPVKEAGLMWSLSPPTATGSTGMRFRTGRGEFTRILRETFDRGGNVVIPSFAVGRTQELLYFIREIKEKNLLPEYPAFEVYVDSPLAIEATTIFNKNVRSCFDEEALALVEQGINPLLFPGLKTSITTEESKQINLDDRPKVIISASGMCEAGESATISSTICGAASAPSVSWEYQAVGTLGRKLLEGAQVVKLFLERRSRSMPGSSPSRGSAAMRI